MLPRIIAHRLGGAYGPDNSAIALRRSLRAPLGGLEADCCLAADGEVVLLHDPLLELGTSGEGWVHETPSREICRMRLRHADGSLSNQRPLLLRELLALAPPAIPLALDIKAHADAELARATTRAVCRLAAAERSRRAIEIISFYEQSCELAAELGFAARLVAIAAYRPAALAAWAALRGVRGVCVEHLLLTRAVIDPLRARGLSVTTGTVNHPALLAPLLELGPDAVTSDRPHELHVALLALARAPRAAATMQARGYRSGAGDCFDCLCAESATGEVAA